ncbi:O-sialoglycoprotein endopeptidase [Galdieria sulphuraria]|uniref:N(6)-L-threonylcarbamoyladenine synthase n=1 Tax=Galdieria sulphuraria TaxID=130081 RepID=M2VTG4_GALSU|nr:O-sialoglycoprotein endopeptidase [Galdieria sulphuraria]EME26491.1 O-sialoglycoprotein endopeptidase [Galdieria sulphuraria]|eukprot:XP_005703011.1 O-sialoglycoprotein endopeptidase [Galdieria sulphuraria]
MGVVTAYLEQYFLQPTIKRKKDKFSKYSKTQKNIFRVEKMLFLPRKCFNCVRCSQQANSRRLVGLPKSVDWSQEHLNRDQNSNTKTLHYARSIIVSEPWKNKRFTVLGVETSCDDTGVAIVDSSGRILGETRAGQEYIHSRWGGVVPALARDAHEDAISGCIDDCLKQANLSVSELDAIAVTMGPGLELCLRVGFESGRTIASSYHLPFVSVHHLEAHCLMARLFFQDITFPFLNVLVSGGHCQLIL